MVPRRRRGARRWAHRHPARAAGALFAAALLVGTPVGYALLERIARRDLRAAYEQEERERRRAELSLNDAIAAIDEMLLQGTDQVLAEQPGADPARRRLLLRALELYEDLLRREREDPLLTTRVISAQIRVANLQRELGDLDEAEAAARRALALCGTAEGQGLDVESLRSGARFALVAVLGVTSKADDLRRECDLLIDAPRSSDPEVARVQAFEQSVALRILSGQQQSEGRLDEALANLHRGIALLEELVASDPGDARTLAELSDASQSLAYFGGFHGRDPDYGTTFARAEGLLQRLLELEPANPSYRNLLAKTLSNWVHVDLIRGEAGELALSRAERADELLWRLSADFPLREGYSVGYLVNAQRLGWARRRTGDVERANEVLAEGVDFATRARERLPESDELLFYIAMFASELARYESSPADTTRAEELWDLSGTCWRELVARPVPRVRHLAQYGTFHDNLARHRLDRGDLEGAESSAREAVDSHREMLRRTGDRGHADRLALSLPLLAYVLLERERPAEAVGVLSDGFDGGFLRREALVSSGFPERLGEREDFQELLARVDG